MTMPEFMPWVFVKSREPEMMQFFSQLVNDTLNGEMDIHRGYMARLGITPEEVANVKPSIMNTSYTHYMLEVGHNEWHSGTACFHSLLLMELSDDRRSTESDSGSR